MSALRDEIMRMGRLSPLLKVAPYALLFLATGLVCAYVFFPLAHYVEKRETRETPEVIDYADLKDILSVPAEGILLVDLRDAEQFRYAHMPNAINIPEPWNPADIEAVVKSADGARQIIIVNLKDRSGKSIAFLRWLKTLNVLNAAVYSGGWEEWKACNLPTESNHK